MIVVVCLFLEEKDLFFNISSFYLFIFIGVGRIKGTINFSLWDSHWKNLKFDRPAFFSLSRWRRLNWCEASGLPLLNLSRAWRISLLQSALEAWSIESVMTTLMVNFCTLWVSVISVFNVYVCASIHIHVLEWWQMIMTHASFTDVLSLFLWLHGPFVESQRAITGKGWSLYAWIRVKESRRTVLPKKTGCFSVFLKYWYLSCLLFLSE